jgi:Flp pilus assembly protein TadG
MSRGEQMNAKPHAFSFGRLPGQFARDRRGAAAIEFAIVLPVMMAIAFSATEFCNAVAIERKLTTTARAISDIVAQGTAVSDAEMANVLKAGKTLLQPYPDSKLRLRVTAVNIDAQSKATVAWGDASPPGDARAKNSTVTIPPDLLIPNTQVIWGEVAYDFTAVPSIIKSLWQFKYENNQMFARPRASSGKVCRPACT